MLDSAFSEKDWRIFREKVPGWQERYMDGLCNEYAKLLSSGGNPSERFWALHDRIQRDKRSIGVQIEMRRSMMRQNLIQLLREKVITPDDLGGFSDDLRAQIELFL